MVPLLIDIQQLKQHSSADEKICQASHYSWLGAEDITNSFRELATWTLKGCCQPWSDDMMNHKGWSEDTPAEEERITVTNEEVEASPTPAKLKNHNQRKNMDSSHACSERSKRWTIKKIQFVQHLTATTGLRQNHEGHAWGTKTPVRAYRQHWNTEWVVEVPEINHKTLGRKCGQ